MLQDPYIRERGSVEQFMSYLATLTTDFPPQEIRRFGSSFLPLMEYLKKGTILDRRA